MKKFTNLVFCAMRGSNDSVRLADICPKVLFEIFPSLLRVPVRINLEGKIMDCSDKMLAFDVLNRDNVRLPNRGRTPCS